MAVGDELEVTLSNTLDFEITLTPSGVQLSENDTEPVAANETKIYSWNITDRVSILPISLTSFLERHGSCSSDWGLHHTDRLNWWHTCKGA